MLLFFERSATALSIFSVAMTAAATLLAGDRISIGALLHEVVVDATADGGGAATLTIEPPLRAALDGGETVKCDPPEIDLRLVTNNVGLTKDHRGLYRLSFAVREA